MPEEQRIDRLERLFEGFVLEMRLFKDEMLAFKEEMRAFKEEMRAFKEEMREFKDEMLLFKQKSEDDRKRIDRDWGRLANKLGTILEDIAAPNVERLALEQFQFGTIRDFFVRARRSSRRGLDRQSEFDVICAGPTKLIYAEMKSTPDLESVGKLRLKLQELSDFFPEYSGLEFIGIYASWSLDAKLRSIISSAGLYGLAMGSQTMEIVARP